MDIIEFDIATLTEGIDVECKLAEGKDGHGALPKDFWESYSAFANTFGGDIYLGIKEFKNHQFEAVGIQNTEKVLSEIWTGVNNQELISCNLLNNDSVRIITVDSVQIIHVHIPRASRNLKPIYRRNNPMTGSYQRQNSADILCSAETIKRMLAEQVDDSRDDQLLANFNLGDLDLDSLKSYRQIYATLHPDNARNQYDDIAFLTSIGAWKRDRQFNIEALTAAGLLMFGKMISIQDAFPNFMLDYQEREQAKAEQRWSDRLTLDGSWSGNLFDFYYKVIRKLTADLDIKIPFKLEGDLRQENTFVHDALREALVNTLVHADFTGRASIFIVKRPDMFGFRNPGLMRIPIEQAINGYESDCRNRKLHQMFHFIGLGERAGSGIPNIFEWWHSTNWKAPYLHEKTIPYEQTLFELRMVDLIPQNIKDELQQHLGKKYNSLSPEELLILSTAASETTISHARINGLISEHSHDLSVILHKLTDDGILKSNGYGQGMTYHLAYKILLSSDDVFGDTGGLEVSSGGLEVSSGSLEVSSGGLIIEELKYPIFLSLSDLDIQLKQQLEDIALNPRTKKQIPEDSMHAIIISLCRGRYLTLKLLSEIVDRNEDYLRRKLNILCRNKLLIRAFPKNPNDPRQAYTSI
ncbi:MAG: AAA family ATPase [Methylophaga sp.]|nr:MAG: AAA family ATPase [Methylophaga sp.]